MAKILKCGDVKPGCDAEIRGESERDVMRKAAEHAKIAHDLDTLCPEMLVKVKGRHPR